MARFVLARVTDVPPGTQQRFEPAGKPIVVFNVAGEFYALRDICPHQGAPLSSGHVVGAVTSDAPGCFELSGQKLVRCPWHGWEYDLVTGQSWFDARANRVASYQVSVESGQTVTREPGPYVAETIPLSVEDDYLVVNLPDRSSS
jgi:nitrite reductase/ring-hydroxylating ferredoxin subunit